jgi:NAD(P)-dependent dehydrogenase (short-subunit alcohol dehydrogenase family)
MAWASCVHIASQSVVGRRRSRGSPLVGSGGAFAYRSSKAAVNMVMRSLAIDLAPRGITCVVINPGWVRTDMGGPHGTQTPAESVRKLRRLIDNLEPAHSGKFFNHDSREYAW